VATAAVGQAVTARADVPTDARITAEERKAIADIIAGTKTSKADTKTTTAATGIIAAVGAAERAVAINCR
jgi:hypothetical protein